MNVGKRFFTSEIEYNVCLSRTILLFFLTKWTFKMSGNESRSQTGGGGGGWVSKIQIKIFKIYKKKKKSFHCSENWYCAFMTFW